MSGAAWSKVHTSSSSDEWETPAEFFRTLDREFGFTLDPCATVENAKAERYFTVAEDGLAQPWSGRVFMNPPYGRAIGRWVAKAKREAESNAEVVVCLLPARTDTRWWHDHCEAAAERRFIKGRLVFNGAKHNAPFPNVVVVFRRPVPRGKPAARQTSLFP